MKKTVLFFIIAFILLIKPIFASISDKVDTCIANQSSYRDYDYCIQGTREEIAFQVALYEKFSELDDEIEEYLKSLEYTKDYYFGPDRKEPYTNGVDDIERLLGKNGVYEFKYRRLCAPNKDGGDIITDVIDYMGGAVSNMEAKGYLGDSGICGQLYKTKLAIYKSVAYNTLKNNKKQVNRDSHKLFTQKQRSKFDKLLDIIAVNISYIERLWMKRPSKLKKVF